MNIQGLQKLTLLDYPGRVACTVFTAGCNFRCPFCHNASLVTGKGAGQNVGVDAFFAFLAKRKGMLEGVCVTGGEPLLQSDIRDFLAEIKARGFLVKLDTNGSFPDKLKALAAEGLLDYAAMDIKNSPAKYAVTVGLEQNPECAARNLEAVRESAAFLMEGNVDYEFRTTVVNELHSAEDFAAIGDWLHGAKRYFLQGFVDSGDLLAEGLHACTPQQMQAFCDQLKGRIQQVALRGV